MIATSEDMTDMKAIVQDVYGEADVLRLNEIEMPQPKEVAGVLSFRQGSRSGRPVHLTNTFRTARSISCYAPEMTGAVVLFLGDHAGSAGGLIQ